jgi:hypothetical protein
LRDAASSSLVGVLVGVVMVLTARGLGWDDDLPANVAALASFGMPRIRPGYRLRAVLASTVTAAGCLVAGILLGRWLPAPWDSFFALAFTLSVSSLAGTAAAYVPWRPGERRGREDDQPA